MSDQLGTMAEQYPDEVGFVEVTSGRRLSFAEWDSEASRLAAGLVAAGIDPGERVAIHLSMDHAIAWVVAYAAIHRARAVAVPVNTRFTAREVAAILEHCEAAAAVTTAEAASGGTFAEAAAQLPALRLLAVPGAGPPPAAAPGLPPVATWEALSAAGGSALPAGPRPDELADILYTSGTTGRPKGVVVRHGNASLLPDGLPAWNGSGWLSCSPLFTFAGITAVETPMRLGMTALFLAPFDPRRWIQAVEDERPAMVFLVPAMAELLLAEPALATAELSSIGLCVVGSAPLAPSTQRRLQATMPSAAVSNAYGMTEAGPAYTVLPKEEAERRAGSVGRAMPPTELFTVDAQGRRTAPGEVGELVVRVPGRPREYYRDPEATARVWQPDGLHTGDLAYLDEDGYVYVVGRSKDVIIRGGNNVHAADVESVLYEHPAVREAAVAGVAHPVLGEDVAAWVVLVPGATATPAELRAFAAAHLADYKVPRQVTIVDALPRNATGKVVKSALPAPGQTT